MQSKGRTDFRISQIKARADTAKLSRSQDWIIEKLLKINKNKEFKEQESEIETLQKGFSVPMLKGKLNRELLKIKKSEMIDSEIIQNLTQLYLHYGLQNKLKQNEGESGSPRILYSKFVGD